MITAYIGKMRSGKTLAMVNHVVKLLNGGEIVYVNFKLKWNPNAPMSPIRHFFHWLGFRKRRYPLSNLRTFHTWEEVSNIAGCTVALDEGWQYFDSYNKLPIEKRMRLYQSGKWELNFLYTVQRYMMTDINLRWSTDEFWESTLYKIPFLRYPLVIYRLYDLEEDNEGAKIARRGITEKGEVVDLSLKKRIVFTNKKMFDIYDTKEDIYATKLTEARMGKKVEASTSDSGGYWDTSPVIWDILKGKPKYDVGRHTRIKGTSKPQQQEFVVARVRGRSGTDDYGGVRR